jgi:hypothetical protein
LTSLTNRDDADWIARDHLAAGGFARFNVAFTVRTLAEIVERGFRAPALYLERLDRSLATSWVVYVTDAHPVGFGGKRPHTDTTVPHVPASERDIMAALLRTPPPSVAGKRNTRKAQSKATRRKRGRP